MPSAETTSLSAVPLEMTMDGKVAYLLVADSTLSANPRLAIITINSRRFLFIHLKPTLSFDAQFYNVAFKQFDKRFGKNEFSAFLDFYYYAYSLNGYKRHERYE